MTQNIPKLMKHYEAEEKQLLIDTAKKYAQLTEYNNHTEALLVLAEYAKKAHNIKGGEFIYKAIEAIKGIIAIERLYNHMPDHLYSIKRETEKKVASLLTDEEKEFIYSYEV